MTDASIDTRSATWDAWREALRDAVPCGTPGAPLAWELGRLRVDVAPGLGRAVALTVALETGLPTWALRRAACPSESGALGTGDAAFDEEVLLFGDARVLAVLDPPTRESLRALLIARRARLDGGTLRLDEAAAAALPAEHIAPTLTRMGELGARLLGAHENFDEALARALEHEPLPSVRARLMTAFAKHPAAIHAKARDDADEAIRGAAATPRSLEALLAIALDRAQSNLERLRAARAIIAHTAEGALGYEVTSLLLALADAPSLPTAVRRSAVARALGRGPAKALAALPPGVVAEHTAEVVAAMRRSPEHRRAGARQLGVDDVAREVTSALPPDDIAFVAESLAEIGVRAQALDVIVSAWDARPDDALLTAILPRLTAIGTSLGELFDALDVRALDRLVVSLCRVAPTLEDGVHTLVTLYPHLVGGDQKRAVVEALGALGDPSATGLLVEVLASSDDALVDGAIAALGEVGDPRALKALERQSAGLFRGGARKAAARAAAERIRTRHGTPEGALALASEGGGLGLAPETHEPRRR